MIRVRAILLLAVVSLSAPMAACSSGSTGSTSPSALGDDAITVGSFDFAESELLAAAVRAGPGARRAIESGGRSIWDPREFVAPALAAGLVELVPDYEGTAVGFLSLGRVAGEP